MRWRLYIANRYALRYRFNGDANFNYVRDIDGSGSEWTVDESHAQDLGERFTLNASLRFVSSDDAPQEVNTIDNTDRYIDRNIRSTVSLRKSWQTTALSVSASRAQYLNITDPNATTVEMTAPSVQLSIPSRNLYFGSDTGAAEGFWQSLLKNTRYSPSLSGDFRRLERLHEIEQTLQGHAGLSLTSPQRLGFITFSPTANVSYDVRRYEKERDAYQTFDQNPTPPIGASGDSIFELIPQLDTNPVSALDSLSTVNEVTWNVGASANTNFYGTFYPRVGRLRGIRHAITPSVTYGYRPPQHNRVRNQTVSFGLRNALDFKFAGKDTTSTGEEDVRKIPGVVIWGLNTSYDPDENVRRAWNTITSNLNFSLFGMNLSLNHSIDPYDLKVLNTNATTGLAIRGTHPFGRSQKVEVRELNTVGRVGHLAQGQVGQRRRIPRTRRIWTGKARGRGQGSRAQGGPPALEPHPGHELFPGRLRPGQLHAAGGMGLQLTDNWRIDYSTIYDVEERTLDGQNFGITRDLHCWEMSFSRQQLGTGPGAEWQYYFRIALKAHPTSTVNRARAGSAAV